MHQTPENFTGGCVCGEIRYECNARPLAMLNCHCRDCQQVSGGPYTPVVYLPPGSLRFTKGTPTYFDTPSEAGGTNHRSFCPKCGSRLTGAESENGIGLTAASWTIRAGSSPGSTSGHAMRSRGTY